MHASLGSLSHLSVFCLQCLSLGVGSKNNSSYRRDPLCSFLTTGGQTVLGSTGNSVSHSVKAVNPEPDWVLMGAVDMKDKETVLIYHVLQCVRWLGIKTGRTLKWEHCIEPTYICLMLSSM